MEWNRRTEKPDHWAAKEDTCRREVLDTAFSGENEGVHQLEKLLDLLERKK